LSIDYAARTTITDLLPGCPRLRTDIAQASRVQLPAGIGSLYRFERPEAQGSTFGIFVVLADGSAHIAWEAPGSGPQSDKDPVLGRIAIHESGTSILVATTLAAAGDVFEVDLLAGTSENRTSSLAALDVIEGGLVLGSDFGALATDSGILRFARSAGAQASALSLPSSPTSFAGEFVLSGNGLVAATVAGDSRTSEHLYTFSATSAAAQITSALADVSEAGYLPEHVGPCRRRRRTEPLRSRPINASSTPWTRLESSSSSMGTRS
jgi:hypothetical protein